MNFATLKSLTIPEGVVTQIADGQGRVLWHRRKYKTEISYLKSTGTQYIDTLMFLNNNSALDLQGVFDCTAGATRFGARNGTSADTNGVFAINAVTSNQFRIDFGASAEKNTQWLVSKKQADRFLVDGLSNTATVNFTDGTSESYTYPSGNFSLNHSVLIFAFNGNGSVAFATDMKATACKLYDNGILVRDFIPVLDWNDVPCMYDKVSGELFYNQGTGEFIYE